MTQKEVLLSHFSRIPNISNMEAWHIHNIRALPRRISDLEAEGYRFRREQKIDPKGSRYVRYHFLGKNDGSDTTNF